MSTVRFNNAVNKLYKAYTEGTLNPMDCKQCAVGNICDNNGIWRELYYTNDPLYKAALTFIENTMYSKEELLNIESLYMCGVLKENSENPNIEMVDSCCLLEDRPDHLNLKGLLLVIDYLAELDNIEVPDIKELFSKKELPVLI